MPRKRKQKSFHLSDSSPEEISEDEIDDISDSEKMDVDNDEKDDNKEEADEGEEFTVECILGKRVVAGYVKYLIKWEGFDQSHNTWEPLENLGCPEILEEFENSLLEKRKKPGRPFKPATGSSAKGEIVAAAPTSEAQNAPNKTPEDVPKKKFPTPVVPPKMYVLDLRPTPKGSVQGLARGLNPLQIVGTVVNSKKKKFFLVFWCNCDDGDLVPLEEFCDKFPDFAIAYFENHNVWDPRNEVNQDDTCNDEVADEAKSLPSTDIVAPN